MTPKKTAQAAVNAALDRKAADLTVLKVEKLTTLADYYVICTGTSNTQLRAIADNVDKSLTDQGVPALHVEGYRNASWVLLDFGSVVVHVFKNDARSFYSLERLWADAVKIDTDAFLKEEE